MMHAVDQHMMHAVDQHMMHAVIITLTRPSPSTSVPASAPQAISCAVVPPNFTCSLMVGGAVGVVTTPLVGEGRNASLFDPALPIALGQTRDSQGRTVREYVCVCLHMYIICVVCLLRWMGLKAA